MKKTNNKINNNIDILYEDNHIIVVTKPEGVLSQADSSGSEDMLTIIKKYLKETYHKEGNVYLGLVHRLDQRVSGVMVYAKSSKGASRLSEAIRNHQFEKIYVAVVSGFLDGKGTLINKLEKDDRKAIESDNGKESILNYEVKGHFKLDDNLFTVVEVELITGKYNQIRKQFQIINHPLINDFKYGYRLPNYQDTLGLRCVKLSFPHPITKEIMSFTLPKIKSHSEWEKYMEV